VSDPFSNTKRGEHHVAERVFPALLDLMTRNAKVRAFKTQQQQRRKSRSAATTGKESL
jgi:hypothetical protein